MYSCPVKSTWIKAIKAGNFMGWTLLTKTNMKKYYPETSETLKGHTDQTRKNVRSTEAVSLETDSTTLGRMSQVSQDSKRGARGTSASYAKFSCEEPNMVKLREKKM